MALGRPTVLGRFILPPGVNGPWREVPRIGLPSTAKG
jgi:hypothetical protein